MQEFPWSTQSLSTRAQTVHGVTGAIRRRSSPCNPRLLYLWDSTEPKAVPRLRNSGTRVDPVITIPGFHHASLRLPDLTISGVMRNLNDAGSKAPRNPLPVHHLSVLRATGLHILDTRELP